MIARISRSRHTATEARERDHDRDRDEDASSRIGPCPSDPLVNEPLRWGPRKQSAFAMRRPPRSRANPGTSGVSGLIDRPSLPVSHSSVRRSRERVGATDGHCPH